MGTNDRRSGWYVPSVGRKDEQRLPRFVRRAPAPPPQSSIGQLIASLDITSELALARVRKREREIARGPTTAAFVGKNE